MARHSEPLSGGLHTSEDSAFLSEGQLTLMQNLVYEPGSRAVRRARGRLLYASVTGATSVDGLRDIQFDNDDHYLVAMASGLYRYSAVSAASFTTLTAITQGEQLDAVHYRNRFFLLNGVTASAETTGSNTVVYLSATAASVAPSVRQHGLLPVIAAPSVTTASGSFSQTVTGYYEYWTTEVAKVAQDGAELILESAFAAGTNPTTVFVSSTGQVPMIQLPATRNPITTHWRVYRSTKKDAQSDRRFPTGFMIGEAGTATASQSDTLTVASASSFPSSFNTSAPWNNWLNASGATASDTLYASATGVGLVANSQQMFYGFNLGGFVGSVRGITIEVQAYATAASMNVVPLTVAIGKRNTTTGFFLETIADIIGGNAKVASKSGNITSTASASPTTLTLGASADRWFASDKPGLADSDFDGNFGVRIDVSKPGTALGVNYVKATVHYSGSVDGTVQYPSVVYTFGDITAQVSKNHPPPSASTGDLFEDSLVLNDVSNPSLIRWSSPGEPEYFPPTYYLDFETRDNDEVTLVKVVGSTLVTGLKHSMWRVNYLPSERDSSFDRGKAMQPISKTYGCYGPMCATTFSMDGQPEMLAWVSRYGIHATDGHSFVTYTDALNWRDVISTTSTSAPICLINDRERQELLFYYQNNANGNETYLCLHLNYSADHLVNGIPKVSGPVHMRNFVSPVYGSLETAWPVQRTDGSTSVFLGYGGVSATAGAGQLFVEDGSTTSIPANDSTAKYRTRRMYLAGFGNEWVGNEVYGYCGSYTGSPVITYVAQNTKTNDTGPTQVYSKSLTLAGQKLHKVSPRATFEGMQVTATITASAFQQELLVIEGEGWGEEDSGR